MMDPSFEEKKDEMDANFLTQSDGDEFILQALCTVNFWKTQWETRATRVTWFLGLNGQ